tara:strand:- start:1558 stop:1803 length:246 start_codon:yes stop_codon:yes gene_type:complete
MSDEVQDHRLSVIEGRLDKHEEMLAQLVESQIRTDEQYSTLASSTQATQDMINDIGKTLIKWMMGIGTSMVTVLLAGTQVM